MTHSPSTSALLEQTSWIRELALRLTSDPNEADDLVQDAVVSALEREPEAGRSLRAWLATVLRNRLGKYRSTEAHRAHRQQNAASDEGIGSTFEVVAKTELQRDLVEAVLALEEPYRSTILLRFFERLSHREIARRTGVATATVNSRLTRGLAQLRTRLDRRYGDRDSWVMAFVPILPDLPTGFAALQTGSMTMSTVTTLSVLIAGSSIAVYTGWSSLGSAPASAGPVPATALVEAAGSGPRLVTPEPTERFAAEPEPVRAPVAAPGGFEALDDRWETELHQNLVLGGHVQKLRLNTGAGNIVVEQGPGFSVTAIVRADLDRVSPSQLTQYFEDHVLVSETGETVTIEDAHARANEGGWDVSLRVTTPRGITIDANSGAGDVEVRDAAGSLKLNSGAGNVTVALPNGSLDEVLANAGAGSVKIQLSSVGKLVANSGAGNVEARLRDTARAKAVSLSSGAGSLKLVVPATVSGAFELETGVGDVTLPPAFGLDVSKKDSVGEKASGTVGRGGGTRFGLHTGTGSIEISLEASVF